MEDALVLAIAAILQMIIDSLNPCFNGRCTSTKAIRGFVAQEDGLNPCFNGRCTSTAKLR